MEIRKFQKEPSRQRRRPFARLRRVRSTYLPVFGSLTSVANTASSQERCSICLDEYAEGTELRVLFCGHEFHPKCVDPWLLSNRRCPLCQFDVVYKQYPKMEPLSKNRQLTPVCENSSPLQPLLLSSAPIAESPRVPRESAIEQFPRSSQDPLQIVRDVAAGRGRRVTSRARSLPRRRPLRPREHVETAVRLGGYSSDVSSR
ncbi:zinc finger, C3HC4 type [Oesophagostomum dentatum]|uniref:Zinc finger, C3HC4 type n=1 Tax=Oesophagostomum dentatum TaxID=61180 RepID=A0A0B1SN54_OESDE|nr:zinc finger, C3HC4 type [Oesophagostomum dentatum]